MDSKFGLIRRTAESAALEHLETFPKTYNGRNGVSTLAPSILIWSSSFLQVTRTSIKTLTSSNFGLIPFLTAELVALECLKKCIILLTLEHKHFDRIFFILAGKEDSHKKLGRLNICHIKDIFHGKQSFTLDLGVTLSTCTRKNYRFCPFRRPYSYKRPTYMRPKTDISAHVLS